MGFRIFFIKSECFLVETMGGTELVARVIELSDIEEVVGITRLHFGEKEEFFQRIF